MSSRQGGGTRSHQQAVAVPVVAALKLDDLIPSGGSPGQTDGRHDGLRSRVDHAHHVDVGDQLHHELGDLHLPLSGSAEAESVLDGPLHRLPDDRVVVPQDHGTPGADIVDVAAPLHVVDVRAVGAGNEAGGHVHRTEGPHGRVDAAGEHLEGLRKELLRGFVPVHHPISPFRMASASSLA